MKVRIYFPEFPFPPQAGASRVVAGQIETLRALGHEVELVTWFDAESSQVNPEHFRWRPLALLERKAASRIRRGLESLGTGRSMPEIAHYPSELISGFSAITDLADWGIYHYSFAAGILARRPQRERQIAVHFHNWESDLSELRLQRQGWLASLILARNARLLLRAERRLLFTDTVDQLWFLSPLDRDRALSEGGIPSRVRLVPPTFSSLLAKRATGESPASPSRFGWLGGMDFEPNLRSAEWLIDLLAPELERRGFTGVIEIIGKNAPTALRERARRFKFILWEGFVPNVEARWSQWSALLCPDFGGSGARIKMLEALASGTPVLANAAALARAVQEVRDHPGVVCRESVEEWCDSLSVDWSPMKHALRDNALRESLMGYSYYRDLGF